LQNYKKEGQKINKYSDSNFLYILMIDDDD